MSLATVDSSEQQLAEYLLRPPRSEYRRRIYNPTALPPHGIAHVVVMAQRPRRRLLPLLDLRRKQRHNQYGPS